MNAKLHSLLAVLPAIGIAAALTGCHTPEGKLSSVTPCMAQLDRFTATDVPAMGPAETESPAGNWTNAPTPAGLPGKGLAQHPMLYVGENYTKMFLVNNGKVIWTYQTGNRVSPYEYDDVWMLSNGNILFTRMQYVAEITPDKKVVWRYDCDNSTGTNHTEVHTCQPIGLDKVMFVVNGLPPRLMVVNIKTGAVEVNHEVPSTDGQPFNPKNIHGQFRRARYTAQGSYLLSYLSESNVVEYDKNFNKIWSYGIKSPWAALRLKNGNTLITDEQDNLTREVDPKGETVWEFKNTDLPAEYRFAQAPQSCTRLANGNTIFTSRGGSGKGPQLVEVTPDKKVVWVLQDWKTLGDATAVQILDDPGIPENPGESEH
jgi:outer membrane protein assembly factor BamB